MEIGKQHERMEIGEQHNRPTSSIDEQKYT